MSGHDKVINLKIGISLVGVIFPILLGAPQEAGTRVEDAYAVRLKGIFDFQERIVQLHPLFKRVFPVALVVDKVFYVFEPDPPARTYHLVKTTPDSFNIPAGVRAAMPLGFWENRFACVVTGEVFDEPHGYVTIFHEFVHCAQAECCEQRLKTQLEICREAMKKNDFMWELQYPFPYGEPGFVESYSKLLETLEDPEAGTVEGVRKRLRAAVTPQQWEYLTWQEWKEGFARFLENRLREALALPENAGGKDQPYSRVTFYRGGDKLIRFLIQKDASLLTDMEKLYHEIFGTALYF